MSAPAWITDTISARLLKSSSEFAAFAAPVTADFAEAGLDLLTGGAGLFLSVVLKPYLECQIASDGEVPASPSVEALCACLEELLSIGHATITDSIDVDFVEELEREPKQRLLRALLPRMGPRLRALIRVPPDSEG